LVIFIRNLLLLSCCYSNLNNYRFYVTSISRTWPSWRARTSCSSSGTSSHRAWVAPSL